MKNFVILILEKQHQYNLYNFFILFHIDSYLSYRHESTGKETFYEGNNINLNCQIHFQKFFEFIFENEILQ